MKIGPETAQKLREGVALGFKTIFESHYTRTISLVQALQPETLIT